MYLSDAIRLESNIIDIAISIMRKFKTLSKFLQVQSVTLTLAEHVLSLLLAAA